jgi:hypothetical protein|tara:strand:+ start:445 stop:594 length:150 start_codon:yes stop_codon:yes gene_type:complete
MNDQTTVETTVEQREENGKPEEDTECISDTVALVGSTIIQNLIAEKEKK